MQKKSKYPKTDEQQVCPLKPQLKSLIIKLENM